MATYRKGLEYFSFDTNQFQDLRIKCLKRKYGCEGFSLYTYLVNEIFRVEGYWIHVSPELLFDISDYFDTSEARLKEIIEECCAQGIFDTDIYQRHGVLTSADIQRRYQMACQKLRRRNDTFPRKDILLIEDGEKKGNNDSLNAENAAETESCRSKRGINVQSADKRKEKKGKEIPPQTPPKGRDSGLVDEEAVSLGLSDDTCSVPSGATAGLTADNTGDDMAYPLPPNDGKERNYQALIDNFIRFRIDHHDALAILRLSNFGLIGHPVWKAIYALTNNPGKFNAPSKFILSQIRRGPTRMG